MAFHRFVRSLVAAILLAAPAAAADTTPAALTQKEIDDGWVLLFDGESTFGWTGKAEVKDGQLLIPKGAALKFDVPLPAGEVRFEASDCRIRYGQPLGPGERSETLLSSWGPAWTPVTVKHGKGGEGKYETAVEYKPGGLTQRTAQVAGDGTAGGRLEFGLVGGDGGGKVKPIKFRPAGTEPLFNGKDLTGWKVFKGDEKRAKSAFAVTPAGELSVKNGPGDLQTERQFADFVLQLECKTNGAALNSGVFFRCVADQYQNGYELQIQNAYKEGDRTKPADFGTGAIYRRVAARKVVSDDNAWFAMTLLAQGPKIATWVNGYPVVSWTDGRAPNDNPRQGLKTGKGHLSIQGHDPTTDLLFRNVRAAEVK